MKDKTCLVTSIDAEKKLDKNPAPIYDKNLSKVVIEGVQENIIMAIYDKQPPSIIFNRQNLQVLPLRLEKRQRSLISPLLFNIILEFLAMAIRQEEDIKDMQIVKKEVKLFICR